MFRINKKFFILAITLLIVWHDVVSSQELRFKEFALPALKTFSAQLQDYRLASGIAYLKQNTYGRASFLILADNRGRFSSGKLISGKAPLLLQASIKDQKLRYDQVIPLDFSQLNLRQNFNINPGAIALAPKGMGWVLDARRPRLYYFDVASGSVKKVYFLNKSLPALNEILLATKSRLHALAVSPDGSLFSLISKKYKSNIELNLDLLVRFNPDAMQFAVFPIESQKSNLGNYVAMQTVSDNSLLLLREIGAAEGIGKPVKEVALLKAAIGTASSLTFGPSSSFDQRALNDLKPVSASKVLSLPDSLLHYPFAGLTLFGDTSTVAFVTRSSVEDEQKFIMLDLPQPAAQKGVLSSFLLIITLALFLAFFYFVGRLLFSGFLTNRNKR